MMTVHDENRMAQRVAEVWLHQQMVNSLVSRTGSGRGPLTLAIFDFDGTMFGSRDKAPSWWKNEVPFSWGMDPRSLDEPCVPDKPGPSYWNSTSVSAARRAARHSRTLMVVVTGRVKVHRKRIEELLAQQGIKPNFLYFNPGMPAATYKKKVIGMLLVSYHYLRKVDIWENENISVYEGFVNKLSDRLKRPITVETFPVSMREMPIECTPDDFSVGQRR